MNEYLIVVKFSGFFGETNSEIVSADTAKEALEKLREKMHEVDVFDEVDYSVIDIKKI